VKSHSPSNPNVVRKPTLTHCASTNCSSRGRMSFRKDGLAGAGRYAPVSVSTMTSYMVCGVTTSGA
jgi:hypothetical protein